MPRPKTPGFPSKIRLPSNINTGLSRILKATPLHALDNSFFVQEVGGSHSPWLYAPVKIKIKYISLHFLLVRRFFVFRDRYSRCTLSDSKDNQIIQVYI